MEDQERTEAKFFKTKTNPGENANFISKLFFCWIFPLYAKGFRKDLTEEDLYEHLETHDSKILGDKLDLAWTVENKSRKNPSLWRVLFHVFGREFILYGIGIAPIELVVKVVPCLCIGELLEYYKPNQTKITQNEAYFYSSMIILMSLLRVITYHLLTYGLNHLGMKVRVACCSLIYRKALKLNRNVFLETSVGKLVNMLSTDVTRFEMLFIALHYLWIAPLQVIVVGYFLLTYLDVSALAGILVLLIFIPLQMILAKCAAFYKHKLATESDYRIRLLNEIISGIQVIKMYTWEKPFAKLVNEARESELRRFAKLFSFGIAMLSFRTFTMKVCVYVSVLTHTLLGSELTPKYLYVAYSFYEVFRLSLVTYFSVAIMNLKAAQVSAKRIENFLTLDNNNNTQNVYKNIFNFKTDTNKGCVSVISLTHKTLEENTTTPSVVAKCVFSKWNNNSSVYHLTNINLSIKSPELVALIGPVGSGKTTLLHVLLREIPVLHGTLETRGRISYASQEPWLFNSSIKQNILFGQEFNQERYEEVVRVCALEHDFRCFPFGDRSLIGERGVMLSGGQKARINLARAVYKHADIYLFDDPLSAIDVNVGTQVFNECIKRFLKNKIVVLVTHQLQYLKSVDQIFLLENGKIACQGVFDEISNSVGELQKNEAMSDDENVVNEITDSDAVKITDLPVESQEHRSFGTISNKVYVNFMKSGGSFLVLFSFGFWYVLCQFVSSTGDFFMNIWVNVDQDRDQNFTSLFLSEKIESFLTSDKCLYIYTALTLALLITTFCRSWNHIVFSINVSRNLHEVMFKTVARATMRFFNTNSSGRILNRFSKDIGAVDELLSLSLLEFLQNVINTVAIIIFISIVNHWLLLPAFVVMTLFYFYRKVFLATSRDLKRLEGTTRSPVFSQLTASLQGLSTIRAFRAERILEMEFDKFQNVHSSAYYLFVYSYMAFGFWIDVHCVLFSGVVILSFIFLGSQYGGNVGFAITQSLSLMGMLQWGMKNWSELDTQMTSVERILEYTKLPTEEDPENEVQPDENWPQNGNIEFQAVALRYSTNESPILKNVSFKIESGEKIGIVGRTGAGKSSLISALFRLAYVDGRIIIDGIDTKEISLKNLRSKIAIIPQEPLLFSGTIRKNLDPFGDFSDGDLWKALEVVELKNLVSSLDCGLESAVADGGANFSVGQRQLFCLIRAILRNNKIVVLDEATSNIDLQSDELIQRTIKKKFRECTVLTIAHRLHTVMNSDKILVMDKGRVVEFDTPEKLLLDSKGAFYGLVNKKY